MRLGRIKSPLMADTNLKHAFFSCLFLSHSLTFFLSLLLFHSLFAFSASFSYKFLAYSVTPFPSLYLLIPLTQYFFLLLFYFSIALSLSHFYSVFLYLTLCLYFLPTQHLSLARFILRVFIAQLSSIFLFFSSSN